MMAVRSDASRAQAKGPRFMLNRFVSIDGICSNSDLMTLMRNANSVPVPFCKQRQWYMQLADNTDVLHELIYPTT